MGSQLHAGRQRVAKGGSNDERPFVDAWGAGTPVILVHGSLATGPEEWQAQRPLADTARRAARIDPIETLRLE